MRQRRLAIAFATTAVLSVYSVLNLNVVAWIPLEEASVEKFETELTLLRNQNEKLLQEIESLKQNVARSSEEKSKSVDKPFTEIKRRDVVVPSMCRCNSGSLPVPVNVSQDTENLNIVQHTSLATGRADKHFHMQKSQCECQKGRGAQTSDAYLLNVENRYCGNPGNKKSAHPIKTHFSNPKMEWSAMPDFGVEEKLPLFLGVLSYKSPLSLNATLYNWEQQLHVDFADRFVQLNARSQQDDDVLQEHSDLNFTIMGSPEENLHPGLAISKFCRQAEQSSFGHPNGENLLMFLEKDWHVWSSITSPQMWKQIQTSMNALFQRGVSYIRLSAPVSHGPSWQCDAQGLSWTCMTAKQHRYTNLPSVIRCDWFLRYLEPFVLLENDIMVACRSDLRKKHYIDWEECMQDGRIAWSNSQWVVANFKRALFTHNEVDQ